MSETDATLSHHISEVAIAEFVGDVPSHAENYDLAVKVATSEQDRRGVIGLTH